MMSAIKKIIKMMSELSKLVDMCSGSGGGARGRVTASCPSRPGSNTGTDLAFLEIYSC